MRNIMLTLLALVAVAFLTRCDLHRRQQDQARLIAGQGQVDLLAFSTGPGHEVYPYLQSQSGLDGIILFGPQILRQSGRLEGLRTAFFAPDLTVGHFDNVPTRDDPEAMKDLVNRVADAPPGTVIAMVSHGDCSIPAEEQAELDNLLADLDALGRPHHETPVSWSFIAIRLPWGWRCLAESFSRSAGVMTTFSLAPGWEHYRQHVPERLGLESRIVVTGG